MFGLPLPILSWLVAAIVMAGGVAYHFTVVASLKAEIAETVIQVTRLKQENAELSIVNKTCAADVAKQNAQVKDMKVKQQEASARAEEEMKKVRLVSDKWREKYTAAIITPPETGKDECANMSSLLQRYTNVRSEENAGEEK